MALNDRVGLRVRARHSNAYTGVQGEWKFNGQQLQPPDDNQWQKQNNLLASADLTISGPSGWQHRLTDTNTTISATTGMDSTPTESSTVRLIRSPT